MMTGQLLVALAFWLFSGVTVLSALMVVSARNPVHSVLYLILAFFNSAALFLLMGAEFIAMILVIVYVGAVAVLFLFVVMMLDVNIAKMREGFLRYLPFGALIGLALFAEILIAFAASSVDPGTTGPALDSAKNTQEIGRVLYTEYFYLFQASGMVLLVAMIGAIVLTLRTRPGVRRQKIAVQVARTREESMAIAKVRTGEGA
jgi:NADH-quinone oxidoreductase subunit J